MASTLSPEKFFSAPSVHSRARAPARAAARSTSVPQIPNCFAISGLGNSTSNKPNIRFIIDTKGVGPAIVRHVVGTIDGQPVRNWDAALQKLVGPGQYKFTLSTMSGHVLAAGESMDLMVPHAPDGGPLTFDKSAALWTALDKERGRIGVEICYSSTLGDCWILRRDPNTRSTTAEARTCPDRSAISFEL